MKTLRKSASVALAFALSALLLIGGTFAFLSDRTQQLTNTFKPGTVQAEISETLDATEKKNVCVKNTGTVPVYVRARVVVTWKDSNGNVHSKKPEPTTDYTISYGNDWTSHTDGCYYYKEALAADGTTTALVTSCKPVTTAPEGYSLSVEVLSQVIQAGTANAAQDAWGVAIPISTAP